MNKVWVICLWVLLGAQVSVAGTMADEAKGYCEKIKTCAKQSMQQEGMPAGMEEMMRGAFDSMCVGIMKNAEKASEYQELHQSAAACFKSKAEQSCERMEDDTPECIAFEKQTEKYEH